MIHCLLDWISPTRASILAVQASDREPSGYTVPNSKPKDIKPIKYIILQEPSGTLLDSPLA